MLFIADVMFYCYFWSYDMMHSSSVCPHMHWICHLLLLVLYLEISWIWCVSLTAKQSFFSHSSVLRSSPHFPSLSLSLVRPNSSQQYLLLEAAADSQERTSSRSSAATAVIKRSMPTSSTRSGESLSRVSVQQTHIWSVISGRGFEPSIRFCGQVKPSPSHRRKHHDLQPLRHDDTHGGRLRLLGRVFPRHRHHLLSVQHGGSAGVLGLHARLQGFWLWTHFCEYPSCWWAFQRSWRNLRPLTAELTCSHWFAGLFDHSDPGLPVAGVFLGLGEGPAEREGCHRHRRHQLHAGAVQGEQHHLWGHGVRQPADPQHLCGEKERGVAP